MFYIISLFFTVTALLASRVQPYTCKGYYKWKAYTNLCEIVFLTDIAAFLSIFYFSTGLLLRFYEKRMFRSAYFSRILKIYKRNLPFFLVLNSTVTFGYWLLKLYNPKLLSEKIASINYKVPFWKSFVDHSIAFGLTNIEIFYYNFLITRYTFIATLSLLILYYMNICVYNRLYNTWPYTIFANISYFMVFLYCCCFLMIGVIFASFSLLCIRYFKKSECEFEKDDEESPKWQSLEKLIL